MFDIITFGSATCDIFFEPQKKDFLLEEKKKKLIIGEKIISFPLGLKIDLKNLKFFSGGGGTNTACTFSNFGFRTAYCGKVGRGIGNDLILNDLKKFGIDSSLIIKETKRIPAVSLILTVGFSRTVFVWKGACHFISKKEIPWQKLRAGWFYLAPLSGKLSWLFEPIVFFAKKNKIKLAANLGNSQIALSPKILEKCLSLLDILILNKEEACLLSKIFPYDEKKVFKRIRKKTDALLIITKGEEGSVIFQKNKKYQIGIVKTKSQEKTGAGDAYASGFLAGFIKSGGSIEYAAKLAVNNASSCISKIGAKEGLLKEKDKLKKVKIKKCKI